MGGNMKLKNGFSLVEVNLAIFVVAIGLLTLFSLFPAGLKEGEAGHADTQISLFADYVLATVRADAMELDADEWDDLPVKLPNGIKENTVHSIGFPAGSGYVRYYLDIVDVPDDLYGVRLWVQSGQYGENNVIKFKDNAEMYYTEIFFSGMP